MIELHVTDLGRSSYQRTLEVQRRTHERIVRGNESATVILVEHDPVITLTSRRGASDHLLADRETLKRLGIEVCRTDRGGDITYHGPGQLVAYPIVPLTALGLNVGRYMRLLEQSVIDAVSKFGISATRIKGCTGVWVQANGTDAAAPPATPAKLAAIGIRVERGVSLHGVAINVCPDLAHFQTIVPCGIADKGVTSMQQLLESRCPALGRVKHELVRQLQRHLGLA